MPSSSPKQARFMRMVAHDPKAAKRVGVSQEVGREFVEADKRSGQYRRKTSKERQAARYGGRKADDE